MIATTRPEMSVSEPTLYVAFELGKKEWKLAMTSGFGVAPWLRSVVSGDWRGVDRAIAQGRARFGLAAARHPQSSGGLGEHRGESAGAARENGSARCPQTGDDAGARLLGGAAGVERSARAERGGGGRAPGQSRADGADARADASDQSTEGLAGDVGRHAAATSPERLVDHSERLGGGTPARRSASAGRPG